MNVSSRLFLGAPPVGSGRVFSVPAPAPCCATLLLLALGCSGTEAPALREASGVCRQGDVLLIVGDNESRGYFQVPLRDPKGPFISPASEGVNLVRIPHPEFTPDLESIDILADGRVVVLSEKRSCLVSADGLVVQYDATMNEIAGRGLEGLAVRPGDEGGSWVAVLWEGGYSDPEKSEQGDRFPMAPLLVVHDLPAGAMGFEHRLEDFPAYPLDVPVPEGEEPEAQRFRAPDLVWHRLPNGEWGFVVLLSSENRAFDPEYQHRWIQRFDQGGKRVGDPVDIEKHLPSDMQDLNWEGLGWLEDGNRLVSVHDDPDDAGPTEALVIDLPEGW